MERTLCGLFSALARNQSSPSSLPFQQHSTIARHMSPRKKRSQWDDLKDLFVIQYLLKATKQGEKSDSGFKKDVWVDLAKRLNAKFRLKPVMAYTQIQIRAHTVAPWLLESC
jgi:hypothetical protein